MTDRGSWRVVSLGEIATLVKGISYASEDYCGPDDGAIFITIKCVSKAGGFKSEGIKYYKGVIPQRQLLSTGDLLIANTDLTRAGDIVGCPITVPAMSDMPITLSMDLSKLVEKPDQVDRRFLYYRLMSDDVRSFMKDHASGSTVLHLQTRAVPSLSLSIPNSTTEQTKIAEIFSTVDQAIEQTEALIAKQQRIKTGLMQDLLTRGIDEHGQLRTEQTHAFKDSPLGRIPVDWEVRTFEEVAEISRGKFTHRPRNDPAFYEGDYPFVQTGDVTRNVGRKLTEYSQTLNERGRSVSKEFPTGTIAITIAANIADTAILGIPMCFPDSVVGAVVPAPNDVRFVELSIRRWKPVLEQLAPQSAQRNINLETLRPLLMAMPGGEEQKRIGALYESVEKAQTDLVAQRTKQFALKTALMQDLLTGRKRVTDLLEPATA
ncbi:MAG: restriction endonuclease subunit S [Rhodoferax sp.]|nr:restriction endonuclease subunit S [Rhodoferax sp.]